MLRVAILIPSDRAHSGERADATGPALAEAVKGLPAEVISQRVVPDDIEQIKASLIVFADERHADVILVAGGTGLGPRDVTPEATQAVVERDVPGIADLIRQRSLEVTPRAALSRAVSGVRGTSLIIDLPGSPKAAVECFEFVAPILEHAVAMMRGEKH